MSGLGKIWKAGIMAAALATALVADLAAPAWAETPNLEVADLQDALEFVDGLAIEASTTAKDTKIAMSERDARIRSLLDRGFNLRYIGLLALGPYRRDFEPKALDAYESAFASFLYEKYSSLLRNYAGEEFHTVQAERAGRRDVVVHLVIDEPQGGAIDTRWRVRSFDGELKIIDVNVAGFSMMESQREEFTELIKRSGIDDFVNTLRVKAVGIRT